MQTVIYTYLHGHQYGTEIISQEILQKVSARSLTVNCSYANVAISSNGGCSKTNLQQIRY